MIDLHTHTNYSDGTWDVKRLLTEAQKARKNNILYVEEKKQEYIQYPVQFHDTLAEMNFDGSAELQTKLNERPKEDEDGPKVLSKTLI